MDDVIRRISDRLAGQRSRRSMLGGVGKLAVGVGALIVGQSLFGQVAEAAANMNCCSGTACADYVCPAGTHLGYTWSCSTYFCHDCFSNTQKNPKNGHWQYNCTYSVARPKPPVHHHKKHHVVHHEAPHPTHYSAVRHEGGGEALL